MNILIIDSTDSKEIAVGLKISEKKYSLKRKTDSRKAQVILLLIEELLVNHKLDISEIQKLEVNTGPGSFTGIRVGISIANTLAFLLKISINDLLVGRLAEPVYK